MLAQVSKSVFYINYYFQGEPFLHPDFLQLIRQAKTHKIYTATSTNAHFIDEKKALEIGPIIQSTFGKAYKAGVKIAFGTDAGVFGHGKNAREFELMHEAGMPVLEAIQSATLNAADLLGQSKNLGTIEVGKSADIIAVEGNPVETIQSMSKVKFVMRDGIVMKNIN